MPFHLLFETKERKGFRYVDDVVNSYAKMTIRRQRSMSDTHSSFKCKISILLTHTISILQFQSPAMGSFVFIIVASHQKSGYQNIVTIIILLDAFHTRKTQNRQRLNVGRHATHTPMHAKWKPVYLEPCRDVRVESRFLFRFDVRSSSRGLCAWLWLMSAYGETPWIATAYGINWNTDPLFLFECNLRAMKFPLRCLVCVN